MSPVFHLAIFLFGLAVGSFLNSIIYRLQTGESFLIGRSFCPYCRHQLGWQDLIPIFSFLILKGKCRYCQKPISWQYPLVEFTTGILFFLIFTYFPYDRLSFMYNLFFYWIITSFLIIIFVYDLRHYIIPDKVIYPAIIVSGIWYLVFSVFFKVYTKYDIHYTTY